MQFRARAPLKFKKQSTGFQTFLGKEPLYPGRTGTTTASEEVNRSEVDFQPNQLNTANVEAQRAEVLILPKSILISWTIKAGFQALRPCSGRNSQQTTHTKDGLFATSYLV